MLHLSKKILIGISLIIAYLLTLKLSLFLTPPFPRLEMIADSISRFRTGQFPINLPAIFTFPQIASTNKPSDNQITPRGPINWPARIATQSVAGGPIFSRNTPSPTQPLFPTQNQPSDYPSQPGYPTSPPTIKPTSTPKPTKPPKPTPTPTFAMTNPRPGKNIRDVAAIVSKIICAPAAMIYAIYDNEGDNFRVESNWTYYNTYHGSDPHAIKGSQEIVGITQMMEDTWYRIKPYVSQKLGSSEISLDVTFDAMAAAAYHVGNVSLAWSNHISCLDWPVEYILYGACRYEGACGPNTFGQKQLYDSYTYSVCASYNEYGGAQKKCQ